MYREEEEFADPQQEITVRPVVLRKVEEYRCVRIHWDEGKAHVVYAYDKFKGGSPKRTEYPRQVLTLEPGEWGRVSWNGRHTSLFRHSGWWYRQDVINVAVLEQPVARPFENNPPREFSDMAHLI